jgi:hypothetical protein
MNIHHITKTFKTKIKGDEVWWPLYEEKIVELDAEWNRREREMSNQQENNVNPERV